MSTQPCLFWGNFTWFECLRCSASDASLGTHPEMQQLFPLHLPQGCTARNQPEHLPLLHSAHAVSCLHPPRLSLSASSIYSWLCISPARARQPGLAGHGTGFWGIDGGLPHQVLPEVPTSLAKTNQQLWLFNFPCWKKLQIKLQVLHIAPFSPSNMQNALKYHYKYHLKQKNSMGVLLMLLKHIFLWTA